MKTTKNKKLIRNFCGFEMVEVGQFLVRYNGTDVIRNDIKEAMAEKKADSCLHLNVRARYKELKLRMPRIERFRRDVRIYQIGMTPKDGVILYPAHDGRVMVWNPKDVRLSGKKGGRGGR